MAVDGIKPSFFHGLGRHTCANIVGSSILRALAGAIGLEDLPCSYHIVCRCPSPLLDHIVRIQRNISHIFKYMKHPTGNVIRS